MATSYTVTSAANSPPTRSTHTYLLQIFKERLLLLSQKLQPEKVVAKRRDYRMLAWLCQQSVPANTDMVK